MTSNKPCPFCGSRILSIEYVCSAWGNALKEPHVVCNDCAASSPVYIWNMRNSNKPLRTSIADQLQICSPQA